MIRADLLVFRRLLLERNATVADARFVEAHGGWRALFDHIDELERQPRLARTGFCSGEHRACDCVLDELSRLYKRVARVADRP